jgi:hypothetical protein
MSVCRSTLRATVSIGRRISSSPTVVRCACHATHEGLSRAAAVEDGLGLIVRMMGRMTPLS